METENNVASLLTLMSIKITRGFLFLWNTNGDI